MDWWLDFDENHHAKHNGERRDLWCKERIEEMIRDVYFY